MVIQASSNRQHLPALDGLRFFAAFFVMVSHYAQWTLGELGVHSPAQVVLSQFSALGMSLFFVLSGFVIHYNYHHVCTRQGGSKYFFIARFSRLYPLFFLLFSAEFILGFIHRATAACVQLGNHWGMLLAVPLHLTLTQDWVYGVICQRSYIFQYHMLSGATWSLSCEIAFYLVYPILAYWFLAKRSTQRQCVIAVLSYCAVLGFLFFCHFNKSHINAMALIGFGEIANEEHHYMDSMLQWLIYFNPLVNFGGFFIGAITANIFAGKKDVVLTPQQEKMGRWFATAMTVALVCIHIGTYYWIATTNAFIGRTGTTLYVPMVAVTLYALVRFEGNLCSRVLGSRLLVMLGEASYSIYLLHAFCGRWPRDLYPLGWNPWIVYAVALLGVITASRFSYLIFEKPARNWLRRKMADQTTVMPNKIVALSRPN